MSRLQFALDRIAFSRKYTLRFLDAIPLEDWFRMPAEGVTHVAWQIGHLAMARYRLTLFRFRGEAPSDEQLIPLAFRLALYPKTEPSPDPSNYPPAAEIRAVFDRVQERVLSELAAWPDADLDSPISPEHDIAKSKIEALHWSADHELVHAGQIALLRRLFGQKPVW